MRKFFLCAALFAIGVLTSCGGGSSLTDEPESDVRSDIYYTGLSFLGARSYSYECSHLLNMFDGVRRPALAVLWPSFGDNNQCLIPWLKKDFGQPKALNVYLYNGPCRRRTPSVCFGEDTRGIEETINRSAFQADALFSLYHNPGDQLIFTIGLEDDLDNETACRIAEGLRISYPHARISRNKNGNALDSDLECFGLYEVHGQAFRASNGGINYAYSNDGEDSEIGGYWNVSSRVDSASLLSRVTGGRYGEAVYFYFWDARFNGLTEDLALSPPPSDRRINLDSDFSSLVNAFLKKVQDERLSD